MLPPELLDKIFGEFPTDGQGRSTLISCALVATWWTGPSQRRLFSSVTIVKENYRKWMDGVVLSGSKTHLLPYVRSFVHFDRLNGGDDSYPMRNLKKDSGEYLSALCNLRHLTFPYITVELIGDEAFHTCFSAFRETLTELSLNTILTSFDAFVTLVDYFPNLATLRLGWLTPKPDEGPVPPLSRPFRGTICICHPAGFDLLRFIDRLAELDVEYDGLFIESPFVAREKPLKSILQLSSGTVKYLRLTVPLPGRAVVTIGHFVQLRELELWMDWSSSTHESILASITSTELRKLIFSAGRKNASNIFSRGAEVWASTDERLCKLVARLGRMGYSHTLEVEFRLSGGGETHSEHDLTKFLPRFKHKGVVTIIDTPS